MRNKNIKTNHGSVKAPFFMPDATRGFIKALGNNDLKKLKIGPIVINALHLYFQPGTKVIKKAGGIHKFMGWHGPLLSDSGGYQIFSLIHKNSKMGKITDKGAIFKSPFDGSKHILTPEKSIQIQFDLGVDMMVALDDCPPNDFNKEKIEKAIKRTIQWAKRCKAEYKKKVKSKKLEVRNYKKPLLFAVIQGGKYLDLRKYCTEELIKIGFDGYGFGARHVDNKGNFLEDILKSTAKMIPKDSLRFALGVGLPEDIVKCASYGWDMFDCVIPTREGRHGKLFRWERNPKSEILNPKQILNSKSKVPEFYYSINILNSKFSRDFTSINPNSKIPELREYSLGYLHHLFKSKELLGQRLASLNNLEFYFDLMDKVR